MASPRPPSYVRRDKTPALGAPTTNDRKLDLFLQNIHERIEANNTSVQTLTDSVRSVNVQIQDMTSGGGDSTGAVTFQGIWDASTGAPPTDTPSQGDYYQVSANGETSLDGITGWGVGDWAVYNGTEWTAVRNYTIVAGDNITLSKSAGNVITITGQETSRPGDAQAPEYIREDETYTVVEDRQVLYMLPITIDGELVLDGSLVEVDTTANADDFPIATTATDITLTPAYWTLLVDATDGNREITLPSASSANQRTFNVKKIDSTANTVTIVPDGSDLIEFDTSLILLAQGEVANVQSDGNAWYLVQ